MNTQVTTTIDNREWYYGVIHEYQLKGAKPSMLIERVDYKFDPFSPFPIFYQPYELQTRINNISYGIKTVRDGWYSVAKP